MTDTRHIDPDDLALHAMQLLSAEEASATNAHLKECASCREDFKDLQSDLELLAMTVEVQVPSAAARERFIRQISKEKRVVSLPQPAAVIPMPTRSTGGKILPWLGWAVAAGVTFSAINLYHERGQLQTTVASQASQLSAQQEQMSSLSADALKAQAIMGALTDSSAMRVTLNTTPVAKALPQGRASFVADKGTLVFIANNLAPLPADKTYELWIIPANGTAPIPAGTFHPDAHGNASVVREQLAQGVQPKAFGVTVEAEGGSATPTMPILLAGA